MNFVERPPIDSHAVGRSGDDLDEVLRAFFRSELPNPWPPLRLPERERSAVPFRSQPRRRWFYNSRFALAASVGLLLIGSAVLSDSLKPANPAPGTGGEVGERASPKHGPTAPGKDKAPDGVLPETDGAGKPDGSSRLDRGDYELIESLRQDGKGPTSAAVTVTPNKK
jgi:hypothetical protein